MIIALFFFHGNYRIFSRNTQNGYSILLPPFTAKQFLAMKAHTHRTVTKLIFFLLNTLYSYNIHRHSHDFIAMLTHLKYFVWSWPWPFVFMSDYCSLINWLFSTRILVMVTTYMVAQFMAVQTQTCGRWTNSSSVKKKTCVVRGAWNPIQNGRHLRLKCQQSFVNSMKISSDHFIRVTCSNRGGTCLSIPWVSWLVTPGIRIGISQG